MSDAKYRGNLETILVTGGAGFIGSHFVEESLKDYNVIVIDKMTYAGSEGNISGFKDKIRFVNADIADARAVINELDRTDYIVNFAAETHVDHSYNRPEEFVRTNVNCLQRLLEITRIYKHKIKKFVHISTDEVYGDRKNREPATEDSILEPNNPYSSSKAAGDMLCRAYLKSFDIPMIIVRSSNNFGSRQYPEKLIPRSISLLKKNKPVELHGNGLYKRDWLYVRDNTRAIKTVMEIGDIGEIYNVYGSNIHSNMEIVNRIFAIMQKDPKKFISYIPDRISQDNEYHIAGNKIKELGWKPDCNSDNFYDYLDATIKSYL